MIDFGAANSSQYVTLGNGVQVFPTSSGTVPFPLTMSFLVRPHVVNVFSGLFSQGNGAGGTDSHRDIEITNTGAIQVGEGTVDNISAATLAAREWYNLTVVWRSTTAKDVYIFRYSTRALVLETLASSSSATGVISAVPTVFGAWYGGSVTDFNACQIGWVAAWNADLGQVANRNAPAIWELINNGPWRLANRAASCSIFLPFTSTNNLHDLSGNNLNGTPVAAPAWGPVTLTERRPGAFPFSILVPQSTPGGNVYDRTGSGAAPATASAADQFTTADAGTATSPAAASGAKNFLTNKSNTAAAPATASGADQSVWVEQGTGAATSTTSGADNFVTSDSATATAPATASGADQTVFVEQGTGTATAAGSGADNFLTSDAGAGAVATTASGADQTVWVETGTSSAPFSASGASQLIHGAGNVYDRTGAGTLAATAGGADQFITAEAGTGRAPGAANGADQFVTAEAGTGASPATAGGVSVLIKYGNVYDRSGVGTIAAQASGADQFITADAGAGQTPGTGAGVKGTAGGGSTSWAPQEWGTVGPEVTMGKPHGLPAHEQRRRDDLAAEFERLVNQIRDDDDVLAMLVY